MPMESQLAPTIVKFNENKPIFLFQSLRLSIAPLKNQKSSSVVDLASLETSKCKFVVSVNEIDQIVFLSRKIDFGVQILTLEGTFFFFFFHFFVLFSVLF